MWQSEELSFDSVSVFLLFAFVHLVSVLTGHCFIAELKTECASFLAVYIPAIANAIAEHFPHQNGLHGWQLFRRDQLQMKEKLHVISSIYLSIFQSNPSLTLNCAVAPTLFHPFPVQPTLFAVMLMFRLCFQSKILRHVTPWGFGVQRDSLLCSILR